jgi:hypothetical protein
MNTTQAPSQVESLLNSKEDRKYLLLFLYPAKSVEVKEPGNEVQVLNSFLASFNTSFNNFASSQLDGHNGNSVSSKVDSGSPLEKQVERALYQVLGKSPGRNPTSFFKALEEAFPTKTDSAQITSSPVRSIVSLYKTNLRDTLSNNLSGQISAQQATLHRHASVVVADALKVLTGLESFLPDVDPEPVEALRSLIQIQIKALIDEFGRLNEPRQERVDSHLGNLKARIAEFGSQAKIDGRKGLITTLEDESNTTGFQLLNSYVKTLEHIWNDYLKQKCPPDEPLRRSLSDSLARADIMLPVIAQANKDFETALDAVGFSESERQSDAARFRTLADFDSSEKDRLDDFLPNFTVYDLTEWIGNFATIEAPSILTQSGSFGLKFITDQADDLFWVVGAIIAYLRSTISVGTTSPLEQILSHERVRWTLDNLLLQLSKLADLAP